MTTDQKMAFERTARLMKSHQDYLSEVREVAPTWCDIADDLPDTAFSPAACELLAESAPDDGYLRGFWLGRAIALREIALLTGRIPDGSIR